MMKSTSSTSDTTIEAIDSSFMLKVFYGFLALAIVSVFINIAGKQIGQSIAMGGHTDDRTVHEIVIGNNVLSVPANEIRFKDERRSGVTGQLEVYLHWPDMNGYTDAARDDFNNANNTQNIIFISFREQAMSRDMSGRLAPIYNALISKPGVPGPGGITFYAFKEKSGYLNELLAVAEGINGTHFVARCLNAEAAKMSLAACERDVHVGQDLSLTYRFSKSLLSDWRRLDASMVAYANARLRSR